MEPTKKARTEAQSNRTACNQNPAKTMPLPQILKRLAISIEPPVPHLPEEVADQYRKLVEQRLAAFIETLKDRSEEQPEEEGPAPVHAT